MGDAWMGPTTDITYSVWMDGTYDAWTGAIKDVLYNVWTDGDLTRILCR